MEYVINRADYRRNEEKHRKPKNNFKLKALWKCFFMILFLTIGAITMVSYETTKQEELEKNNKKLNLVSQIKNETDYRFEKSLKIEKEVIEELAVPCVGTITSKFGFRNSNNPIVSSNHMGIDIGAPKGTNIVAAHAGIVIEASEIGTYGKCVMIQNENLITVYAHCSSLKVKKGDKVEQNQKIAEVGMTGNATGNHLHFEIRKNGICINPEDVIDWS